MPWSLIRHAEGADPTELYRLVIEGAPAMLWLGDEVGKCVFLNKAQREFWGVAIEDIATFDWSSTLHPEDVDALAGPFQKAMATHTKMTVEARYRRADGVWRVLHTDANPRFDGEGRFLGMVGVNVDVTDQRQSEADLRAARDALALATQSAKLGVVGWDFADGQVTLDEHARTLFGLSEPVCTMDDWTACISSSDRAALRHEIDRAARSGDPFDFVYQVVKRDGTDLRIHGTGTIFTDDEGVARGGTGLVRDVTEQWRETEFQKLLIGELNHRMKNVLAIARSLVAQTGTEDRSIEEFKSVVLGRIQALSDGLALTEKSESDSVAMDDLAETVLTPFGVEGDRIAMSGPPVLLPSSVSRLLGLVIHELATNAVKYGALSVPEGKVALGWTVEPSGDRERLTFDWRESGGPPVPAPERRGFGTRLLERMAALETGGQADLAYEDCGLSYRLSFDIERAAAA